MNNSQSIRDVFFQECEDLLDALADGLGEIADGASDSETVNAVFRAVHSIKGGAGAFGLEELVAFAHRFETVLDKLRSGEISQTPDLVRILQKSGDVLFDLVEAAREGDEGKHESADHVLSELDTFLDEVDEGASEAEAPTFEPLGLDFQADFEMDAPQGGNLYEIEFTPFKELFDIGHEPVALIKALSQLGELEIEVDITALPELEFLDHDLPMLSWRLKLTTAHDISEIKEIFEFVVDLCELSISEPEQSSDESIATETQGLQTLVHVEDDVAAELVKNEAEPEPAAQPHRREKRDTLRVDVDRIDRLINLVGELIVNQAMISQRFSELADDTSVDVRAELEDYKQLARDIQEGVMSLRTQPVRPLFQRMARIVREAAEASHKFVKLVTDGEWTEVDKKVTEKLADPLTHMIRNSVDHGIEPPEKRLENNKKEVGTVYLSALHKSGNVIINIRDDGAGLNRERILGIAKEKGLVESDAVLSNAEIDELLFLPGFSTAKEVTNLSGRGVGMDVVRTAISALGGKITISSTPGEGTTFSIQLPLTLAVLDGMVTSVGDQTLIIPISSILEAIRPNKQDIEEVNPGSWVLKNRGVYLPIVDLATCLGLPSQNRSPEDQVLLVVSTNSVLFALSVDAVFDQRQVVIKSLSGNYGNIDGVSAATILGDGSVALIVDPDSLQSQLSQVTADQTSVQQISA